MSQSTINPASQANPPMPADGGQGAPDPDQTQDQGQDGGGFVVILAFQQDGSIQVMQQGGDQDDGSQGGQGDQPQPQVVGSLQDAFQAVEQIAQQNGYEGQSDGDDDSGEDGNAELAPDDASAMWNKMAAKSDKRRMGGM